MLKIRWDPIIPEQSRLSLGRRALLAWAMLRLLVQLYRISNYHAPAVAVQH